MTTIQFLIRAADQAASQAVDYTPAAIGLGGTLIGAFIALSFNWFSHRDSKRAQVNRTVVDLLQNTDKIRVALEATYLAQLEKDQTAGDNRQYAKELASRLRSCESSRQEAQTTLAYIKLTAPMPVVRRTKAVMLWTDGMIRNIEAAKTREYPVQMEYGHRYDEVRGSLVFSLAPRPPSSVGGAVMTAKFSKWARRNLDETGDDFWHDLR